MYITWIQTSSKSKKKAEGIYSDIAKDVEAKFDT